jgi:hypothetical protein
MSHDLFLSWLSERTDGGWEAFKAAHTWLFAQSANPARIPRPSWTAYLLASLGHVEVDWRDNRWSVTAPTIAGLPSAGATAVLVGSRPRVLLDRLQRLTDPDRASDLIVVEYTPPGAPKSIYIQHESVAAVTELAQRLGAQYEAFPARHLSGLLPSLAALLDSARTAAEPPRGYSTERLEERSQSWVEADIANQPGLYRFRSYGPDQYRLNDGCRWLEIGRDLGVWAALARTRNDVLKYQRQEVNGTLSVPGIARLPLLHARAAVLCSGLPPTNVDGVIRYVNVPRTIAVRIARSLGQSIDQG